MPNLRPNNSITPLQGSTHVDKPPDLSLASAIIVAAGNSTRMAGVDKVFTQLLGEPLIAHTIKPFLAAHCIAEIVLVLSASSIDKGQALIRQNNWDNITVVPGGDRRQDSVIQGLKALRHSEWIIIHDGARPCVDEPLIWASLASAKETGASIATTQVNDTIKVLDPLGLVDRTPVRDSLAIAQTPQAFKRSILEEAIAHNEDTVTDEATLVEILGHPVATFKGAYTNIKVTTPLDLLIAKTILQERADKSTRGHDRH